MNPETAAPSDDAVGRFAQSLRHHHATCAARPREAAVWRDLDAIPAWLDQAREAARASPAEAAKAAEWLLDNEYHIRRAIRQVRADMPPAFYRRLPCLAAPECLGLPRVFLAARGYLDMMHARFDLASVVQFMTAYQGSDGLQIAELWAFPAMLRLACIESVVLSFSDLVPGLDAPFSASLRATDVATRDATEGISRAIMALAAISRIDWKDFVEATSHVEAILRDAPDRIHARMDFETRDMYRRAVEDLAQGSGWSETQIARKAVRLSSTRAGASKSTHTGWWLVGDGRSEIEAIAGYRQRPARVARGLVIAHPWVTYTTLLVGFGLPAVALPVAFLLLQGVGFPVAALAAMFLVIPASIIAVTLANWLVTLAVLPRVLPKMETRDGLPAEIDGAVIFPVIFRRPEEVPPMMAQLERHWLTNADPRLRFALLSDLADAAEENGADDTTIEKALVAGVRELNDRYAPHAPFVLLHRRRVWCAAEQAWMGWERKRGKLEQFTDFQHGGALQAFPVTEGDLAALRSASFVATLDADTVAPPGAIHRLFGALAHPLNRAEFDAAGDRVLSGYTFVQPRIEISPEAGGASLFTRLYTGDTAIDIYSRAVSDVYQDLFGEGIFTGKGAYDAKAFRQALHGRVPENALVSHDLFEGLHGRVALASDIVFYEGFPARYPDYARRLHRWIRGDWQLLPWLGRRVPGRGGIWLKTPLSALDRWKILDNMRRSIVPPSLVLLALCGWLVAPSAAPVWTLLVVMAPGFYLITNIVVGMSRRHRRGAVRDRKRQFLDHAGRWALEVVFMANEAVVAVDAIARALWRTLVSRRFMLEWVTAAHVTAEGSHDREQYWREMAGAPVLGLSALAALAWLAPVALPGALPLLMVWIASPEIARVIGLPRRRDIELLSEADRTYLRRLARRTWLYFETFAGPADNWLAPDNHQIEPYEETAHRSSPTNIGMQFLSSLAALDLGHAGLRDVAARTDSALSALDRIERHRGHLVNWFDTTTLESLEPRYVSTVDSGNLATSLVTMRAGLLEATEGPAIGPALWDGLADTLGLLGEAFATLPATRARPLIDAVDALSETAQAARGIPSDWDRIIRRIRDQDMVALSDAVPKVLDGESEGDAGEIHLWLERCRHHVASIARDLGAFSPWLRLDGMDETALVHDLARLLPPDLPMGRLDDAAGDVRDRLAAPDVPAPDRELLGPAVEQGIAARRALRATLIDCAHRAAALADGMDFRFLFDPETRTFFLGYNLSFDQIDEHRYDLLASEARLASYFAIAKGDIPAEHWFHLGRPLARTSGALTVLSWNGSMFEYLMPALLIRSGPGQLLGQSEAASVDIQRRYGDRLGLPWGVSEAAFAARDAAHRYQYRAFGVPGLGLKAGLAEDYVVAPYATALALAVAPRASVANMRRLETLGLKGRFGFHDAVDFTPSRRDHGSGHTVVGSFMAHHQGMLLAAIDNALCRDILVRRFNRDRRISAIDLLLHERVPWEYVPEALPEDGRSIQDEPLRPVPALHGWPAPATAKPQVHAFGNGRLSVWLTDAGHGTLWWNGQSLTRRAPDPRRDECAATVSLRDAQDGETWDFRRGADRSVDVLFHADRASLHLRHHGISATQDVTVAAADDVEIRRVTLVNHSDHDREIEVTSYAEPVLAPHAAHERHPAFSRLFLHAEPLAAMDALLFTRRPPRSGDSPPVMLHRLLAEDGAVRSAGFECDRRVFLGRHGNRADGSGLGRALTGSAGWTLDPVSVIRGSVRLAPGERARLSFLTVAAGSRETALAVAEHYSGSAALDWAFEDSARSVAVDAARMGATQEILRDAQRLTAHVLGPPPGRPAFGTSAALPGQPDLWGLGLSGDLPIVLVRVGNPDRVALIPLVVRAHRWWRRNGLRSDLVILSAVATSYETPIAARLRDALRDAGLEDSLGWDGGVHLHSVDRMTSAQFDALEAMARLKLDAASEMLAAGSEDVPDAHAKPPIFDPGGLVPEQRGVPPLTRPAGLTCDNGLGGFASDGRTYVIHLDGGRTTPVPWCNVLANESFGTIVSEAGLGFTWNLNSGEFRLTPWSNDPVTDAQGEALYLRDEESAAVWTVTQLPSGDGSPRQVTHGAGETTWACNSHDLEQRLTVMVPSAAPVKLVRLSLVNRADRPRRVTATYYAEWQLGALASMARAHVVCGYHAASRALTARNGWAPAFARRIAFLTASRAAHSLTCDRADFLGSGGMRLPEALRRWDLGGRTDGVQDACAAYQVHLDLAPGAQEEVVFVLGAAADEAELQSLTAEFVREKGIATVVEETRALWDRRLGTVRVETPDPAFDLMVNRWLPYQALGSRIFARAGFQQASGGIGFRDQLQDMMAFLVADPDRVRDHILDCAAHQFEEGDVLHWWHPSEERGIRTRCSDDMLWLVYATHRYVMATGDAAILSEIVPYLSAPPLEPGEEDRYAAFEHGAGGASLLDHCARALERGMTSGAHGLPLIGSGDWNDGMDRVGHNGRGESVWLAWFRAACSEAHAELAARVGRDRDSGLWRARAVDLRRAAETAAWDGAWYIRAFDDDGEPWGSSANEECRIDSIAQSWSVLAGAPDVGRAKQAVAAAMEHLVDRDLRLVRLLAPPFDRTPRDPGYIRAYPPGVRENGGQYTHAATWLGLALARLGDGDAAYEIFDLINPVRRSATPEDAARYRGEPYVMPADVGGARPFEGRAGWTWYTGAAAWSWRLGVEGILGLTLRDGALHLAPCLPRAWRGYSARVQGPRGRIELEVVRDDRRPEAIIEIDGARVDARSIAFPTDGTVKHVTVRLGVAGSQEERHETAS